MADSSVPANIAKSTKFRDISEIMAQPRMKALLNTYVDQAVKCKMNIGVEQESIKGIRQNALDELGLKPAVFNAYVAMTYNNDYVQRKEKLEELLDLVDQVMLDANLLPNE